MKTIIYTLICITFLSVDHLFAQCDNNVSTNPNNPTNDALPDDSVSTIPYTMDERFLNGLDWWSPSSYNLTNMEFNPGQPYGSMSNIQTINQQQYYTYLKHNPLSPMSAEQMNPENGWELLLVNLGRYPDNTTVHGKEGFNVVPYLVFYHRYTGVVRVFVRYGNNTFPNDAINGVKINLYYNTDGAPNNLSGIFRLGDGLDRTLDQTTKVSRISAVAPPNGQANFWLSADFQTAYDPCVCHYPTDIKLDFEYFSTTSLKLYGRGISTEEELIGSNGNILNNDFLGGVDFSSQMNAENGFVIYKNMIRLVDDYYDRLQVFDSTLTAVGEHNDKVERNLAIIKVAKIALTLGTSALTGTTELISLITLLPNINSWDSIGQKTFWKELDKVLFEGLDLLIKDNLSEKSIPQAPTTPTASFSEMYFEGLLENRLSINGPQFHTPGSFQNESDTVFDATNSVYSYPVYNNPLGVFALLEKPKIDFSQRLSMPNGCQNTLITMGEITHVKQSFSHLETYQFKLKEPLKYTINPALKVLDYSIDGSVVIEFETIQGDPIIDPSQYVSSSFINSSSPDSPGVNRNGDFKVISTPIPIHAMLDHASQFSTHHERTVNYVLPQSELQKIDELCNVNIGSINHNDYTRAKIKKSYLKLSIDITYDELKSNSEPHTYNYNFTYDININDGNQFFYSGTPLYPNLSSSNSSINLGNFDYDLTLNGANFNGQNINGCVLENNTYLCKAENNIELQGTFTVDAGYEVIVQAANEINVLPESVIPPEMTLQIGPFHDLSNPMPPVDAAYVQNFCQDENEYKARAGMIAHTDTDSIPSGEEREEDHFAFNVFPNPTGGRTTVSITLNEAAVGELFVTDVNGRRLGSAFINRRLSEGKTEHQLPTESLASGIYLVHLVINGERHVKRLVKK
jgi:hypothetical protein